MAHLTPLDRADLPEHEERFELTEQFMGFVPNSLLTMARVPGLVEGFQALASSIFANPLVPPDLVQLVANVTSTAAGCRYCQAHTGHSAERLGVTDEKLRDVWTYETSDLFSEAERAALRLAEAGGSVPNRATPELFDAARAHYSEDQLAAIVAVISLFGYLNRWNDTVATDLEASPADFASATFAAAGWTGERHGV